MKLRSIYFTLLFVIVSLGSWAANGCYVAGTGRMYYDNPASGGGGNTYYQGTAYYVNQASCSGNGQYFGSLSTTNTNCWAVYDGSGSTNNSSNYLVSGKKATFTVFTCPLDANTLGLLLGTLVLGYFFISKSHIRAIAFQN